MNAESAYALAARAVQGLTMATAAVCVVLRFSPPEQGLFFVFLSFGVLVQAGDLGLGYAALQVASHLAHEPGRARLAALLVRARRLAGWSLGSAGLVVAAAGALLLSGRGDAGPAGWAGPWFAYIAAVTLAHRVNVELMLLEGERSARLAWRIRMLQEAASGIVLVAALLAGAGLWSLALHAAARSAVSGGLLATLPRREAPPAGAAIDWRREVWPFQWRLGASVLSGFLAAQALNPIVLLHQGSTAAGRFGIVLAVMNLLLLVTSAWPASLAARWGLLAAGRADLLRRSFQRTLLASTSLALLLAAAALGVLLLLNASPHPLAMRVAARLADAPTLAALLATGLMQHGVLVIAVLLRAERREPLLAVSLAGGAANVAAVWWAAQAAGPGDDGLFAAAAACAAVAAGGLLWTLLLYRGFAARVFGAGAAVHAAASPR